MGWCHVSTILKPWPRPQVRCQAVKRSATFIFPDSRQRKKAADGVTKFYGSFPFAGASGLLSWPKRSRHGCTARTSQAKWQKGIEIIGPNRASMFIQLMPLFSAVMAIIIFNEKFQLYHFTGACFIVTGIYLSNKKIIIND